MRVLFSGSVVSNGGDRAIVEAQESLLRQHIPGMVVVLGDNRPAVARRVLPHLEAEAPSFDAVVRLRWGRLRRITIWLATRRVLAGARARCAGRHRLAAWLTTATERDMIARVDGVDAVAYVGGTSLVENYWLTPKFFELELAHALGKPVVLMTQSLGPFEQSANRKAIRRVSEYARLVLLRDARSQAHLHDVGADTSRAHVLPDIVFSRVTDAAVRELTVRPVPAFGARVAMSVRTLQNFRGLAAANRPVEFGLAIADFVTWLVRERGANVTFLSTCQGVPEYAFDDAVEAARIVADLPADVASRVDIDSDTHDTNSLAARYADHDVVVATRLHAAIIALSEGVPVLPVAYEFKTHTVFGGLGLSDLVTDVADLTSEDLQRTFTALVGLDASRKQAFAEAVGTAGDLARRAGPLAATALAGVGHTSRT